jgi:hypothetical protein
VINYFSSVNHSKIILVVCLFLTSIVWAGAQISSFEGYDESNRIIIHWSTESENNVIGFEVQRSMDGTTFYELGFLHAQGQGSSYTFIDDSIIAKVSGRDYFYRLKVRLINGEADYSETITVHSNVSGVNHTWGSLKALFK